MIMHVRAPRCVVVLALLWLLAPPLMAAGPPAGIATLRVDIWPEHDDPRVLVIYRGTLVANVRLPHTLTFPIPTRSEVHAAAYRQNGQLLTARYQATPVGDRVNVSFVVPVPDFQFEYYVDALTPPPQRTFAVGVVCPLPVANFEVSVEQPLRASALTLTPPATGSATSGGFTYYLYAARPWPAGTPWTVRGSYRKEDATPSVPPSAPVASPSPAAGGRASFPWLVAGLVGVAVGIGGTLVLLYFRRSPVRPTAPRTRRDRVRYCSNCGRRADPRDRFCSNCGRPLPAD